MKYWVYRDSNGVVQGKYKMKQEFTTERVDADNPDVVEFDQRAKPPAQTTVTLEELEQRIIALEAKLP